MCVICERAVADTIEIASADYWTIGFSINATTKSTSCTV